MPINIKPLASSSLGNCYFVSDGVTNLLLECGLPIRKIKEALNFQLSSVEACLISHSHGDHCKSVRDLQAAGIDCYMTKLTADAIGLNSFTSRLKTIEPRNSFRIGTWRVVAFDTVHDSPGSVGYLMESRAIDEKVLFLTDSAYVKYRFEGLTRIMIECNYDSKTLLDSLNRGAIHYAQYKRILATHFGLENVVEFLKANDLSRLKEIYLLHLSSSNSKEELIVKTIRQLTGVRVVCCKE